MAHSTSAEQHGLPLDLQHSPEMGAPVAMQCAQPPYTADGTGEAPAQEAPVDFACEMSGQESIKMPHEVAAVPKPPSVSEEQSDAIPGLGAAAKSGQTATGISDDGHAKTREEAVKTSTRSATRSTRYPSEWSLFTIPEFTDFKYEDDCESCASSDFDDMPGDGSYASGLAGSTFSRIDTLDDLASILRRG
eukprot:TRINITY_DN75262_c0_g1_i1.p1 TRINITY_DN75262_c0_g1~~TRINITY_DN75262_c0_g1_i1.p1  ORF type:complete len:191 (-),score=37.32 TRINITY_DN75262_c0_g1_i1:12-584(-)